MMFTKTFLALSFVLGVLLISGCSSSSSTSETANEVHGPPAGAQPGAARANAGNSAQ